MVESRPSQKDVKLFAKVYTVVPYAVSWENAKTRPRRWCMTDLAMHEGLVVCCSAQAITYPKEPTKYEG